MLELYKSLYQKTQLPDIEYDVGTCIVISNWLSRDLSQTAIIKKLLPKAQLIALSATISNDFEISKWLNAELVKSNYRAVKLYEGVRYKTKGICI